MLDDMGILPCGHPMREQGILLKLWSSCHCSEQETYLRFVQEGLQITNDGILTRQPYSYNTLKNFLTLHTTNLTCLSEDLNVCTLVLKSFSPNWKYRTRYLAPYVYLVRGEDKGKPAWHYVLVDAEKENVFKNEVGSGSIDVAMFGKIVVSGWGKDPSDEIKAAVKLFFAH